MVWCFYSRFTFIQNTSQNRVLLFNIFILEEPAMNQQAKARTASNARLPTSLFLLTQTTSRSPNAFARMPPVLSSLVPIVFERNPCDETAVKDEREANTWLKDRASTFATTRCLTAAAPAFLISVSKLSSEKNLDTPLYWFATVDTLNWQTTVKKKAKNI